MDSHEKWLDELANEPSSSPALQLLHLVDFRRFPLARASSSRGIQISEADNLIHRNTSGSEKMDEDGGPSVSRGDDSVTFCLLG